MIVFLFREGLTTTPPESGSGPSSGQGSDDVIKTKEEYSPHSLASLEEQVSGQLLRVKIDNTL